MTALRVFQSELKRLTAGVMPRVALGALLIVPLLYGLVYLYANWNPSAHLNTLNTALVVEDTGTKLADGKTLDAGAQVAKDLENSGTFHWTQLDSSAQANEDVKRGKYAFALIIPKDFSKALASPSTFDASQAILNVTTNDANNYLLSNFVTQLTRQVHDSVAKTVGEDTANQLLTGFGKIHGELVQAADGADKLADGSAAALKGSQDLRDGLGQLGTGSQSLVDGTSKLADGATALSSGATQLSTGAQSLDSGLGQLNSQSAALPQQSSQLAQGAAQVAAGNKQLNESVQSTLAALRASEQRTQAALTAGLGKLVAQKTITAAQEQQILAELQAAQSSPEASQATADINAQAGKIQQLADGAQKVSDGAAALANAAPQLTGAIGQAKNGSASLAQGAASLQSGANTLAEGERSALDGATQLRDGVNSAQQGASQLTDGLSTLNDGTHQLATRLHEGAGTVPNPTDQQREDAARVMSDPVRVDTLNQAPASTYGSGLAPFFLGLSMWIGVFMLAQAMRPASKRALASNAPAWRIALGGWYPFAFLALIQATVLFLAIKFVLRMDIAHPWGVWALLLFAAITFSALIQGLIFLLGAPGKFVVLLLLILQLVGSGGTFPWQTTPPVIQAVHQFLPLSYVVTALRQLIYGGDLDLVIPCLSALLIFLLVGLGISIFAAHRQKFVTLKTLQPQISI